MTGRLALVGVGIGGADRMTLEARSVLASAAELYHLTPLKSELAELCRGRVVDLSEVYHAGPTKAGAYASIVSILVEAVTARETLETVAFVTYGHPLFFVDSAHILRRRVPDCLIVPGLSAFDTLLVDSPVALGTGAQIYEATRFVALNLHPDAREPVLLMQFGDYAAIDASGARNPKRLALLQRLLTQFYPPQHLMYVVVSPWAEGVERTIVPFLLRDMAMREDIVRPGSSLVIPPISRARV